MSRCAASVLPSQRPTSNDLLTWGRLLDYITWVQLELGILRDFGEMERSLGVSRYHKRS